MPSHRPRPTRRRTRLRAVALPLALAGAAARGQDTSTFAGHVPTVGVTVATPAAALPAEALAGALPTTEAPEPASLSLLASGVVAFVGAVWMRKGAAER